MLTLRHTLFHYRSVLFWFLAAAPASLNRPPPLLKTTSYVRRDSHTHRSSDRNPYAHTGIQTRRKPKKRFIHSRHPITSSQLVYVRASEAKARTPCP
ncbi:hypothetical protein BCR34DRAFT_351142 [Clohesyomyces aquaticus]|uniref:Secreted protein n=1 Tax=Clohesyomyces aquaticus TaxID=1231657 RepID=A0A1Y1ZJD6_9PLEO|nr:hypothetical protein BCR34DRAFT_351142 [Clohesyomyces aquaticus]